ncbi:MAG: 1-deoxy-D-xylulose-5-phosphate reductoisomerase [Planctomycetota bacterium]|nr:1-deoxy-D-xylulose-5-phosphate reductoisomerase [Planctomycetota bacterium]
MTARRVIILGATGSIGRCTVEVIDALNARGERAFEIVGVAARRNAGELEELVARHRVPFAALVEGSGDSARCGSTWHFGQDAVTSMIDSCARPGDLVVAAMVGAAGIAPVLAAIERGCDIALANKETLVAAGQLVTSAAQRHSVRILPVDSEHNAVFQCLQALGGVDEVARLVLTASGGPFRSLSRAELASVTPAAALRHPTWVMGAKVTIDSASMMNKALELIEAHWLFGLPASKLDAIIHPQSIVHSFVECVDGSVLAQLSPPDMRLPIQHALCWPKRMTGPATKLDWTTLRSLQFESVDHDRFPALTFAWEVIRAGGSAGATLNAANEVAVEAFLAGHIPFPRIFELVADALDAIAARPVATFDEVVEADHQSREWTRAKLTCFKSACS